MSRYPKKVAVEEPTDSELLAESIIDSASEDEIEDFIEPTSDSPLTDTPLGTGDSYPPCPGCKMKVKSALWPTPGTHQWVKVCAFCGHRYDK